MDNDDEKLKIRKERKRAATKGAKSIKAFLQDLIRREDFLLDIRTIRQRWGIQKPKSTTGSICLPELFHPNSKQARGVSYDLLDVIEKYDLDRIVVLRSKDDSYHDIGSWLLSYVMSFNDTPVNSLSTSLGDVCFLSYIYDEYCHKCSDSIDKKFADLYYPIKIHVSLDAGLNQIISFIKETWKTEIEPLQYRLGKKKKSKPRIKPNQRINDLIYNAYINGQSPKEIRLILKKENIHKTLEEVRNYIRLEKERRKKK